jgi:ComF family protein
MRGRGTLTAIGAALGGLTDLVYPPMCALCGAPGADGLDLCAGCRADLPGIGPCCARCALPLPGPGASGRSGQAAPDRLCGPCQRHPPPFDHCHAPFRYEDPLPALIAGLKFRGRLHLLRLLGALLARSLSDAGGELPALIVPVPLHPQRLRRRGYNQALELARVAGRVLELPVDSDCCSRVLATRPQADLDQKARRRNLRGAFRVTAAGEARLAGRHVAILDDVVTTATTVGELARALRQAGCARVDVWAIARTP